ncbi:MULTISPECIES: LysR family transcriptional regulator [Bacillus cereus group]|uniref:HTH-type transcriptional regulator CzcR n=1 Tax=Bacillus cereus TaxID=1396 RepID=A0AA44TEV3_BACCE|nr:MULTISPECIES: LysR family transcriptional regulator [Bacillus cereus group]EEL48058.1 Transcriptional regulator (LysR family) [Bacillus cereus Rock3-44]PFA22050.1 LysR family transcriptional regulator [Bacillus cereus]PFN09047.1 LysR family transcriptional regulator [Bacillus cereus]PFO85712.1 LysR family transcriptional regulator [Bacillus cereus]PFR21891.1 LysR family transcriptional regulator [Bacillus cereus]
MDIRQLRYFFTIAQEGQITRAAKKLHMAQPPLSQQLKLLEQELGVLLLERNGRQLELTEAGSVLFKKAQEILYQFDETISEVKEVGNGLKGTLSIGSVKSCFSYIPERLRLFREKYPLVTFRLYEGDSFRLAESIKNREIELAVVRLPVEMEEFSFFPLPTDKFVVVIPDEKTDKRTTISMKELATAPLMLLQRIKGFGLYEKVLDGFKQHGLKPNIICDCPDAAMLLSLVKSGVGFTLLPKSTLVALPLNGVKIIDIEDSTITSDSAVIWLKNRSLSKIAIHFLETFQDGNK